MAIKSVKAMVIAANAEIETIDTARASALLGQDNVVFLDVRDGMELTQQGQIKGAVHAPRGMLEFLADPEMPMHNPAIREDSHLVVYCASGGRSALSAKTLKDLGYKNVCHIGGGIQAWKQAGLETV